MEELNNFLGNSGRLMVGREVWRLKQAWREVFGSQLKEDTGKWAIGETDWHVFSFGYFPYVKGIEAQARFESHVFEEFYVTSSGVEFKDEALLHSATSNRHQHDFSGFLTAHSEYYDLYCFGKTPDWTMIFTNESSFDRIYAAVEPSS